MKNNVMEKIKVNSVWRSSIALCVCVASIIYTVAYAACPDEFATNQSTTDFNCPECTFQTTSHNTFCYGAPDSGTYCALNGTANVTITVRSGICVDIKDANGNVIGSACQGITSTPGDPSPSNTLTTKECVIA
jgi:hypothetical protein